MFSGFGSPSLKSVQRRLSRSISRAGELLTGVGPTPTKQFKNAIIDGEEDKAIDIYTANDGEKPLYLDLHPSKPFPSKKEKSSADTPLHMASRAGLMKLCVALLGKGGDPTVLNDKLETCLHCVCSEPSHPDVRTAIMEVLLQWRGVSEDAVEGEEEKVSLNRVDNDGDTAIHLAALNGLVGCVEKLVALGAIISIVNKNNRTCCELADESNHSSLALALELALVFQPVDASMAEFVASQRFPYDGHQGRLLLSGQSFVEENDDLDAFIDEALQEVATALQEKDKREALKKGSKKGSAKGSHGKEGPVVAEADNQTLSHVAPLEEYIARAEALLGAYAWNVAKLVKEYRENPSQVLAGARLQPIAPSEGSPPSVVKKNDLILPVAAVDDASLALPLPPPSSEKVEIDEVAADVAVAAVDATAEVKKDNAVVNGVDTIDIEIDIDIDLTISDHGDIVPSDVPEGSQANVDVKSASDEGSVDAKKEADVYNVNIDYCVASADAAAPTSSVPEPVKETPPEPSSNPTSIIVTPVPVPAETVAPMEKEGFCFVCGEPMLPGLPVEQFLTGRVDEPGSRRLQCGSGHAFCVDCWTGSLTVQVKDNGLGCLPCLGFKCGEVLDKRWAQVLLPSKELRTHFLQRRQRLVVDCCAALKACPIDDCGVVVRVAGFYETQPDAVKHSIPTSALCSQGHLFCLECAQPAHSPCTCQQLTAWQKLIQDEIKSVDVKGKGGDDSNVQGADLANALWVAANTKKCPRCQTPIEKDEGCNHMNCRKCRKEFCWICMQDWSLHSDNTGGYFQCNRFVANAKVGDLGDGGSELVGNLWAEESGNAHAETMRLREKNKRMARFIHHFTRYQAHRESVQLEGRMFKETARRIHEGLLASKGERGTLKWLQGYHVPHPLVLEEEAEATDPVSTTDSSSLPISGEKSGSLDSPASSAVLAATESRKRINRFTDATAFLKDGFEELLKCRCILQWSYPYAYFEFELEDYNDYARSAAQQQRARYGRGHHATFDLLQSELEAIVETLSDVVARRRLRAGKDQISLVTRAARSKRIELESVIVTSAVNQQMHRNRTSPSANVSNGAGASSAGNTGRSSRSPASTSRPRSRSRPESRVSSSRSGRANRNGSGPVANLFRTDSDESIDLASLIFELEMASATDGARLVNANANASSATNVTDAAALLQTRTRQLESLEGRLRQAFGNDSSGGTADVATDSHELPPPIPAAAGGSATSSGRRSGAAGTAPVSAGSTPNTRRLELRQTRSSPGGPHLSYSIDPDFNMESDSDSASASEDGNSNDFEEDENNADPTITADGMGRRTLSSGLPPQSQSSSQQQPSAESAARAGDYERAAALRELLRFGSAGGVHSLESARRDSRQQMREIRLRERAEEEQALNRAILMSLQENQSADRRRGAATARTAAAGAADSENAAEEGQPAPVNSELAESDVAMLESMGFTKEQATQALVENGMDVELAANRLLGIDF